MRMVAEVAEEQGSEWAAMTRVAEEHGRSRERSTSRNRSSRSSSIPSMPMRTSTIQALSRWARLTAAAAESGE